MGRWSASRHRECGAGGRPYPIFEDQRPGSPGQRAQLPEWGGASTGYHRFGSARPFYITQSAVSSSGTDARLALTSDTSRLFHVGSGGTSFLGGPTVLSAGSYPGTVPQRHYWATEFGRAFVGSLGSLNVTIPNSGFSGSPFVLVSILTASARSAYAALLGEPTASRFTIQTYLPGTGVPSDATVDWFSIGTRVF